MNLSTNELERWLEWAGQRLIAMPGPRVGPADFSVIWPDYAQDKWEITEFRARIALRVVAPGPEEIGLMEEILLLPNLIPDDELGTVQRKIVRRRTLLHPITDRHLWTWNRLSYTHRIAIPTVQNRYHRGLDRIRKRLSFEVAKNLQQKFDLLVVLA